MHDDSCEHTTQNYHIFKHEVWSFDPTEFLSPEQMVGKTSCSL